MTSTVGQVRLGEWLGEPGHSQEKLGVLLNVSQASVSHWLAGTARPGVHFRTALLRVARIPVDDWLTPKERGIARGDAVAKTGTGN